MEPPSFVTRETGAPLRCRSGFSAHTKGECAADARGKMAECPSFELDAFQHNRISNPLQRPCCLHTPSGGRRLVPTRKPFGLIPFRTGAKGRLGSPSIWRRMIGIEPSTLRSPAASNGVGEPTPAFSKLADDKRVELSAFRSHRVSNARPEPSGDIIQSGAPGGIRTRHCLVSKTSASYRWATGANWCGLSDSNGH
jgi:hypothetical protein